MGKGSAAAPSDGSLIGRGAEQAELEQLLVAARAGRSAILLVRGEPGMGKTALLEDTARQAAGCRIMATRGVQAEHDLPYAGLHILCAPFVDGLSQLPATQREALETAIGLRAGPQPDRFLIGLGLLALLSTVAESQPLLCIIDDAQWLDRMSAEAIAFVARRLEAQPVALLIAQRPAGEPSQFSGLPELALGGISAANTRQLFRALIPGRVDEFIVARVIDETRGNPRALLEFLDGVAPARYAGGIGLNAALPSGLGQDFATCIRHLPPDSWQLLVLAAAEPVGDPAMMWHAAAALGIPMEAADPLEAQGLVSFGSRVLFARPVVRSVVYGMASKTERRRSHRALAGVGRRTAERSRRAWHIAQGAAGPDDDIAQELDCCAGIARKRAGRAAMAEFLERAAMLTLDPGLRANRALRAAEAKLDVGYPDAAARLVVTAELAAIDPAGQDRVQLSRAQVAATVRSRNDAAELLVAAAQQMESTEPTLARETYLDAVAAALRMGSYGSIRIDEIAAAARVGPPGPQPPRPNDLLLDALVVRLTKSYVDAVEPLRWALGALHRAPRAEHGLRWLGLGGRFASDLWDDEMWHALTALQLKYAREDDVLAVLPDALVDRAMLELGSGDFAAATALVDEADSVTARMGAPLRWYASLVLAGWQGHDSAVGLFERAREDARERAEGVLVATTNYSAAVLYNGLRRYEDALVAASESGQLDEPGVGGWTLVEMIEAATRRGRHKTASVALEQLSDRTSRVGSDWALGTEARCRALLSDDHAAEGFYVEAIERLSRCRIKTELARAQLVYGEWLRRQGRRLDARVPLRAAGESFTQMGADAFAERARLELLATGETARNRAVNTLTQLTAQESRVACLARDGLTNPEIGERLFVSPKTVEYHLHKIFAKLEITSRNELHLALANGDRGQVPECA